MIMEVDNYEQIKDEVFDYCNEKKKKEYFILTRNGKSRINNDQVPSQAGYLSV